jgi:hypothetical protein
MFANAVMMQPETWNDILKSMIAVRDAHGWREEEKPAAAAPTPVVELKSKKAAGKARQKSAKPARRKPAAKPLRQAAVKTNTRKPKAAVKAQPRKAKASAKASSGTRRPKAKKRSR